MRNNAQPLRAQAVPQAVWHYYRDAQTGTEIPAIGSLRHYRFYRRVRLEQLVIHPVDVRWNGDDNRSLPAELELHSWDNARRSWQLILKNKLPRLPKGRSHRIKLGGIETQFIKALCLRQHTVPPNAGEQWANPHNVPYSMLAN